MDILYNDIVNQLTNNIPELKWVDLDTGQYEAFEGNYPVLFPAVLIDFPEVQWQNVGRQLQTGDITVTLRLGFKIIEDTHAVAPDRAEALLKLRLLNTVHQYIQALSGAHYNKLNRVSTTKETLGDTKPLIIVYTLTYVCNIRDNYGMPPTTTQTVNDINQSIIITDTIT